MNCHDFQFKEFLISKAVRLTLESFDFVVGAL